MDPLNPFAALVQNNQEQPVIKSSKEDEEINKILEIIFEMTLNPNLENCSKDSSFIFIGDSDDNILLNQHNLDDALLRRIMLTDPSEIQERQRPKKQAVNFIQNEFVYLFNCFNRLNKFKNKFSELGNFEQYASISNLIVNMCRTIININDSQENDLCIKFFKFIARTFKEFHLNAQLENFYETFIKLFDTSDIFYQSEDPIEKLIEDPIELKFLKNIFSCFNQSLKIEEFETLTNTFSSNLELLTFLTKPRLMKYLLIHTSFIPDGSNAQLWQTSTLIGKLLTPSVLPLQQFKSQSIFTEPQHQFRYFMNPTQMTRQDVEINEKNMHQAQQLIDKNLVYFFYEHLLRSNSNVKIRNLWLIWVSKCMSDSKAKAQEWSNYGQNPMSMFQNQSLYPSEGFFMNLLNIFLNYSMPFLAEKNTDTSKLLKINFNYANPKYLKKNFTLLDSETKFIPIRDVKDISNTNFNNFITECFYFTHNLIRLSYLSLYQKLMKLNSELSKWQSTYQDLTNSNDPQMSRLKTMFENMTCEFMNLKSIMTEENLVKKLSKFVFNTSLWLSFVTLKAETNHFVTETTQFIDPFNRNDFIQIQTQSFNLDVLSLVPEFFLTNIVEFIIFINRFKETLLPDIFLNRCEKEPEFMDWYLYFVLTFMGRSDRLFNPHLRAQIAESIECLLPRKNESLFDFSKMLSEKLFLKHECSSLLTESLLNVFVSIEMTGQSVQFEQKFNYRRPMYELIEHLWLLNNPKHRDELKKLSDFALNNIESHEQPLFLKFLNYLINDANYLLVEGFLYLEKIKINQDKLELDRVEKNLTSQQRAELESSLKHMIMLAKFHNFMSLKTIQTIRMLTSEIKDIFCHPVLVDRITTMLNDFLLHLVGKKKRKQLKVKNFEEVEFKPKEMVSIICDIYLNLGIKRSFCESVCRDGRSYSVELFNSCIEVLQQIGRDVLWIDSFKKLSDKIEEISNQMRMEEANFEDAPDEYLDPIMSCLMEDPVLLPNSKKIVDRSTISRHLLSDQTDPFNRSPLTLQEVIPAVELKKEIEEWKKGKLKK